MLYPGVSHSFSPSIVFLVFLLLWNWLYVKSFNFDSPPAFARRTNFPLISLILFGPLLFYTTHITRRMAYAQHTCGYTHPFNFLFSPLKSMSFPVFTRERVSLHCKAIRSNDSALRKALAASAPLFRYRFCWQELPHMIISDAIRRYRTVEGFRETRAVSSKIKRRWNVTQRTTNGLHYLKCAYKGGHRNSSFRYF